MPLRLHHSDDDFAARFSALVDAERAADADVGGQRREVAAERRQLLVLVERRGALHRIMMAGRHIG